MKKRHLYKSNVLLINITRLGDMIQSSPTIAGIKMENPQCQITALVERQFMPVCKVVPNIDRVVGIDLGLIVRALDRPDGLIDAYEYVTDLIAELKGYNFDYCLNMASSAYSALLIRLLGINRVGGWTSTDDGYRRIESPWSRLFAASVFHKNRQLNSLNLVDIFRCAGEVEAHPHHLLLQLEEEDEAFAEKKLAEFFGNSTGPLIAIQAGASQKKRQWHPQHFADLIKDLDSKGYRMLMTGTKKELPIIEEILALSGIGDKILNICGATNVPQLGAILKLCDLLVTGDTGTMHMSVAVDTPVVALFLASAYGFETGPYHQDSIVIQPFVHCSPCNPNKACSDTICHQTIAPIEVSQLVTLRLAGPIRELPENLRDLNQVRIYRTFFDEYGFFDMERLNDCKDELEPLRLGYRRLWLEELGGYKSQESQISQPDTKRKKSLQIIRDEGLDLNFAGGMAYLLQKAEQGKALTLELKKRVETGQLENLSALSNDMEAVDREIEQLGLKYEGLSPLSKMFAFDRESLLGTDVLQLNEQMQKVYVDLATRVKKFIAYSKELGSD